jgi:hypothetical protein
MQWVHVQRLAKPVQSLLFLAELQIAHAAVIEAVCQGVSRFGGYARIRLPHLLRVDLRERGDDLLHILRTLPRMLAETSP